MIVTTEDKKNVFLGVIQKIKKGLGNEENELVIIKAKEIQLFQNEESKQSYTFLCWRHVAKQAAKKNAGDFLCVQFRADTGDPFRGIAERFPRSGKFLSGPGQSLIYAPIMNKYYEKNVCSCVLEFWTRLDGLRYEICSYSNHMAAKAAAKIDLKDSVLCFMTTHNGVSTPYATTTIHNNFMRTLKTKNRMLSLFQDDRIIAVIDTETTGINSNKDRIVQFSGKKYRIRDQKMEQIAEMDIYIKAPFPMPEAAMRVNGITDEFLADKPSEEDVVAEICAFMEGSILVGYNVDFDIRMISALCDRTHTPLQCSGKMDVLEVARDLVEKKEVQNHKLETISKYFGIDEGITFHSSIDDVEATARLLLLFYTMYCEQDMYGEGKTKLFIEYTYFWKGYRKEQAGVYVQTNLGKVYFSTYKKEWCSSQLDLTQIDLDALETDILVRLGITYDELSKMTEKKYHLLEKNA